MKKQRRKYILGVTKHRHEVGPLHLGPFSACTFSPFWPHLFS